MKTQRTYGAEIEKAVSNKKTNLSYGVSQRYFERLADEINKTKTYWHYHFSDLMPDVKLGVVSPTFGEQGLDNGFNLLETSFAYTSDPNGLEKLQKLMLTDLQMTQKVLSYENATVINMSNHPLGKTDEKTYKKFVAPKGVYPYIEYQGWDHAVGIDANAQNCPTTGISVENAVGSFNVMLGVSGAIIGLFANSPYDEGKRSPYKESRIPMWDRMFDHSKHKGDLYVARFPEFRFRTLADYFQWMFGEKTSMHFVLADNKGKSDYKGIGDRVLLVENNPSLLEYLSQPEWEGTFLVDILYKRKNIRKIKINPTIMDMELLQWAQFAGVRIRFGLHSNNFPLRDFLSACKKRDAFGVEKIFSKYAQFMYIEGRDPGANFPDKELWEAGSDIAESVIIAPSALQAGLLRNLKEAVRFIDAFKWDQLRRLRESAIKYGLRGGVDGFSVYGFIKKVFEIAARGLNAKEHKLLAYPEWVLKTKKNGADRAIEFVEQSKKPLYNALKDLVQYRSVII